jgi:Ca2+-binding EF-hand superfamily protein
MSRAMGANSVCPFKGDQMPIESPEEVKGTIEFEEGLLDAETTAKLEEVLGTSSVEAKPALKTEMSTSSNLGLDSCGTNGGKSFRQKTKLQRVVLSDGFELICTSVIVLNTLFIGYIINDDISFALDNMGAGSRGFGGWRSGIEVTFLSLYVIEFILRLMAFQCYMFKGSDGVFKAFDFCLVVVGWIGLLDIGPGSSIMWMRTFKAMNALMRTLRVLRVVHIFREIRVLIVSVAHALRSLVWVVLAQLLLMYMFALLMVNGVSSYLLNANRAELPEDVRQTAAEYWGSLPRGMLTLYQSVTGGGPWRSVTSPLLAAGPLHYTLFLLYIAVLVLVVLRLFTGVLVQHAKDALASDREANIAQNLRKWFRGLDEDGSGKVNKEEFEAHMADENAHSLWSMLKVDRRDARKLFILLDESGDGEIDIHEFTDGILKLNGWAKNVDMILLMQRVNEIEKSIRTTLELAFLRHKRTMQMPKAVWSAQ